MRVKAKITNNSITVTQQSKYVWANLGEGITKNSSTLYKYYDNQTGITVHISKCARPDIYRSYQKFLVLYLLSSDNRLRSKFIGKQLSFSSEALSENELSVCNRALREFNSIPMRNSKASIKRVFKNNIHLFI